MEPCPKSNRCTWQICNVTFKSHSNLCLSGCALIQIPDLILSIYSYLKSWIHKRNAIHHDSPSSHTPHLDKSTEDGYLRTLPTTSQNCMSYQTQDDVSQVSNALIDQAISDKHLEERNSIKDLQMLYSELKSYVDIRISNVEKKK